MIRYVNSLKMLMVAVLLCSLGMIVVLGQTQDDMLSGGDAGNTIDDATLIEIDSGNGFEGYPDQYDWYKIAVVKDQTISVRLSSNTWYFSLELYDTNQQRVDSVSHDGGDSPPVWVTWTATKPGFFYVLSKHFYGSYDTYSLLITGMAEPVNEPPIASFIWYMEETMLRVNSTSIDDESIAGYYWYLNGELIEGSYGWQWWWWDGLQDGVYEVTLYVEDDQGLLSTSFIRSIEIDLVDEQPPEAYFTWQIEDGSIYLSGIESTSMLYITEYRWVIDGEEIDGTDKVEWWFGELEPKVYTVSLTVLDNYGLSESYTVDIEVTIEHIPNDPPEAYFTWWMDEDILYFDATGSTDDREVVGSIWYQDGELVEDSFTWMEWSWEKAEEGIHNITLIVVDDLALESTPYTEMVEVEHVTNQPPVASFEWWIDEEEALNFDATMSMDDGNVTGYIWYEDGEIIEDSYDWDEWYWSGADEGTYNITLIVVDDMGLESTPYTEMVTVEEMVITNQPPVARFEWEMVDETLNVDASDSLDSYTWTWEGIPDGTYIVTLEVTDDMDLQDTYRATIEVGGDPPIPWPIPGPSTRSIVLGLMVAALIIGSRKGTNLLGIGKSRV